MVWYATSKRNFSQEDNDGEKLMGSFRLNELPPLSSMYFINNYYTTYWFPCTWNSQHFDTNSDFQGQFCSLTLIPDSIMCTISHTYLSKQKNNQWPVYTYLVCMVLSVIEFYFDWKWRWFQVKTKMIARCQTAFIFGWVIVSLRTGKRHQLLCQISLLW